jgi:hypothetical protein
MTNDQIILTIVEPKEKKLGSYIFNIDTFLIACGLILLHYKILPFEITFFLFIGVPIISIPTFLGINHNLKNFKLTNDRIIINKDKLIRQINGQTIEESFDQINKIILKYSGFDEGPFNHAIFNRYPKLGNSNFIQIFSSDNSNENYEFYIKTKRDSIVLKNIFESLRSRIRIEIILNNSR